MAFRRTEGMSMIQALAMTVAEIPVFLYTTFGQCVRKGMVAWMGRVLGRRPVQPTLLLLAGYSSRRVQSPSSKSNDTLSGISSIEPSKRSGSCHSVASMAAVNSSSPTAVGSGPWDARAMEESLTISDGNAESLYMQGMELFEEALQKWEQALSVGQRGDSGSTPTPGDSLRHPETASEPVSE
ncbi:mitoguardin 2-like, partial [Carlito syrichta]|uniref:Mitoguardin 2 n=1 Tax=Carlito syrichta TaxID=1868482 RepID=A0A3Q0DPE0_CARSF